MSAKMKARYEFKYLLPLELVPVIRDRITSWLEPDPYGDGGAYTVASLYFDDWEWTTAWHALEGLRERFKLRMRTYKIDSDLPVFLEIKERIGTSIIKSRSPVPRAQAEAIASGTLVPEGGFHTIKPKTVEGMHAFRNRMDRLDMVPRLWVKYEREAFVSPWGDGSRLTFDTELMVQSPDLERPFEAPEGAWRHVPLARPVIMEMKFNGASPAWMQNMIHNLELDRVSCSKYAQGAVLVGEDPWHRVERGHTWTL